MYRRVLLGRKIHSVSFLFSVTCVLHSFIYLFAVINHHIDMQHNIGKKITSLLAVTGLMLSASPIAYAGTISVTNNNTADITTVSSVSSNSGGNTSRGERGSRGGEITSYSAGMGGRQTSDNTAGDGGDGGH